MEVQTRVWTCALFFAKKLVNPLVLHFWLYFFEEEYFTISFFVNFDYHLWTFSKLTPGPRF